MPDINAVAEDFRNRLIDLDAKTARAMANAYKSSYNAMFGQMQAMTKRIQTARDAGEVVDPHWLFRQTQFKQSYNALRDELTAYTKVAQGHVVNAQGEAIDLGVASMKGMVRAGLPPSKAGLGYTFASPNDNALRAMVGYSASGSPLSALFKTIAPESQKLALRTLQTGVALGTSPFVIGKQLEGPLSLPLWRSTTIARTETSRAYRESQRQTIMANSDVLEGWVWSSAKDRRTCAACWAMDGKMFTINEVPASLSGHYAGHQAAIGSGTAPLMASGPTPGAPGESGPMPDTMTRFMRSDGTWAPARQALHDSVLDELFAGTHPVDNPTVVFMGGGPASGKSAILGTGHLKLPQDFVTLNPDDMKGFIPEYKDMIAAGDSRAATVAHEESSYLAKRALARAAEQSTNVLYDAVGDSGIDKLTVKVDSLRQKGARVEANYVTVDTETAIARAVARGKATGRVVPEEYLRETHADVSRTFPEAIKRGLFDEANLWDTNGAGAKLIATYKDKVFTVLDQEAYDRFVAKGLEH